MLAKLVCVLPLCLALACSSTPDTSNTKTAVNTLGATTCLFDQTNPNTPFWACNAVVGYTVSAAPDGAFSEVELQVTFSDVTAPATPLSMADTVAFPGNGMSSDSVSGSWFVPEVDCTSGIFSAHASMDLDAGGYASTNEFQVQRTCVAP